MQPEFKRYLKEKCRTTVWYGLAGATELWQAVDQGLGRQFKTVAAEELQEWLEDDVNLEKWENGNLTAQEKRVLITHFVGEAAKKIFAQEDTLQRYMQRGESVSNCAS